MLKWCARIKRLIVTITGMLIKTDFHFNATHINIRYFNWCMAITKHMNQVAEKKIIFLILKFPTSYCLGHLHLHT